MELYLLFTIIAILLIILLIIVFRASRSKEDILLHQKIDSLKGDFSKNFIDSQNNLLNSLSKLYEKMGVLDSENKAILDLTKSFHDILKPTKSRGILGESILENLLKDILPKEVIMSQYTFKDGKKVDFAIKLPEVIVPIDAKFSVDTFTNYLNAPEDQKKQQYRLCVEGIKKRITETAGYIYPDEGTADFSLMYVPSEAVYYFIITETSLLELAHQKKVFITGPNTLYSYLKTILIGFQAMKIEEGAKQIYSNLKRLEKDFLNFMREYSVLGTHLRSASSKYEDLTKRLDQISVKLETIGDIEDDNTSKSNPPS